VRNKNFTILVIEDNDNDLLLIMRAWRQLGVNNPIQIVTSGEDAIAYLKGIGEYADRSVYPYPSFITTDLKMPGGDGLLVLEHLKSNPEWAVIPTAVLSASMDLDDIKKSYMLGASSYHLKPAAYDELRNLLKALYDYWLMCEVPQVDETGKQLRTESAGKLGDRYAQPLKATYQ